MSSSDRISQRRATATKRGTAVAAIAAFTLGIAPGVAFAAVKGSDPKQFSAGSKDYRNIATIIATPNNAQATTSTGPMPEASSPPGYVSSRGRLYNWFSGSLSCQGTTTYNTSTLNPYAMWVAASCSRTTSGRWESYGYSQGYSGSSYTGANTYHSPYLDS